MDIVALRDIDALPASTVLTVGVFDGVHLGHAEIIRTARKMAERLGCRTVAMTFDPHPADAVAPDMRPPLLTTVDQRIELLAEAGVETLVVAHALDELFALEPEPFVEQIVTGKLRAREVVEGADWTFGRNRRGTLDLLRRLCRPRGIGVTEVPWVTVQGRRVSSTEIRKMLGVGDVASAAACLGRQHSADGAVVRGAGRGVELGVPTANIETVNELLPAPGVYAGEARVDGRWHTAAVFVGPALTFGETATVFEAHLIDFRSRDIHGEHVRVRFTERLRDNLKFDTPDALTAQMLRDIDQARQIACD